MTHHVAFLAFDGFQLLDVTGPASAYGIANDILGLAAYRVSIIATEAPLVRSRCGLGLAADPPQAHPVSTVDSFFVVGGEADGLSAASRNVGMRQWAKAAAQSSKRYGSVCSGSVCLAAWHMIGKRRFASHWAAVSEIKKRWPDLNLDPDSIFVEDGPLWTSAGITTGIDMTLAIIEHDHGAKTAQKVAQRMVLSLRRPGTQSQFSPLLAAQSTQNSRYADLIGWIALHLDRHLGVEQLAARVGETVRSFHRNFTRATGQTPSRYVTAQRLDLARALIMDAHPLKIVAAKSGFGDVAQLSAAFQRHFGMSAGAYRVVHGQRQAGVQADESSQSIDVPWG